MKWLYAALVLIATPSTVAAQTRPAATAEIHTADTQSLATATFTQAADEVLISIAFSSRTALVGTHALQIHNVGQCNPPAFDSAGPIISQGGDLPNLVIGPAGVAVYNLAAPQVTLQSLLGGTGTSLVIFAEGNAGQRIACGVIQGSGSQTDLSSAIVIALMGSLLVAGGLVLRRSP